MALCVALLYCIIVMAAESNCQDDIIITRAPDEITQATCTEAITLICVAQGSQLASIEWFKVTTDGNTTGDSPLSNTTENESTITVRESIRVLINGVTEITSELEIQNIKGDSAGLYECVATSGERGPSVPETSAKALVLLECLPIVSPSYQHQAILVGSDVNISFAIENAQPPVATANISWVFTHIGNIVYFDVEIDAADERLSHDKLTLMRSNVTNEQGNYTLTAVNSVGRGAGTIFLDLQRAPHDFNVTLDHFDNDIAVIHCVVFGDPPPITAWVFNGTTLSVSDKHFMDNFTYDINNDFKYEFEVLTRLAIYDAFQDRITDSGEYTCTAYNSHGAGNASIPYYPEPQAPVIIPIGNSSQDAVVTRDIESGVADLGFKIVSALPPVSQEDLTWSFSSINNAEGPAMILDYFAIPSQYSFSNDRLSLNITNLSLDNEGVYSLTATNIGGTNISSISLTVFVEPQLSSDTGTTTTLEEKQNITLTCSADGKPRPALAWFHNGSAVSVSLSTVSIFEADVPGTRGRGVAGIESSLTITNLTLSDSGEYTCIAHSDYGSSDTLRIPFILSVTPESVLPHLIPIGSSTLEAVVTRDIVSGAAVLRFQIVSAFPPVSSQDLIWSFISSNAEEPVMIMDNSAINQQYSFSSDRLSLNIANLSVDNAGVYTLTASNIGGTSTSSINLTIFAEPQLQFSQTNRTYSLKKKQNITLTCSADGKPRPALAWLHNGSAVSVSLSTVSIFEADVPGARGRGVAGIESSLTITNLTLSDSGEYTCTARSDYGTPDSLELPFVLHITADGGSSTVSASMVPLSLLLAVSITALL